MDMTVSSEFPTAKAITYCSLSRFHRSLTLPATSKHGKLRVTYSLIGAGVEDDGAMLSTGGPIPLILWCHPMFGGRWFGLLLHHMASKMGVRACVVDRPGFGGSTGVDDLSQRIPVWLETVPVLLKHLNVEHVTLASYSAGTPYLLNTLFHLRHILNPQQPYVAMLAPWVHPKHSKMTGLQLAEKLPAGLLNHVDKWISFLGTTVMPAFASGANLISMSGSLANISSATSSESQENKRKIEEACGMDEALYTATLKLRQKYMFAEDISGVSQEMKLCLKAEGEGAWGLCEDYQDFVARLVEQEKRLHEECETNGSDAERKRLRVHVFFAETDGMIGTKGQEYFQLCWGEESYKQFVEFESTTTEGTIHDTVWEPWREPMERIFSETKQNAAQQ